MHSLRHRMKDGLRNTGCPEAVSLVILGHGSKTVASNYGSGYALEVMRELQATSGDEGDKLLGALPEEYKVRIILSEDFAELASYLRLRNANALRNAHSRLGRKADRLRFEVFI